MQITHHRAGAVLVLAATAALAAGCGGAEPPAAPPPSAAAPTTMSTSAAPTTTAPPSTTAAPRPPAPLPRAADGTNLRACRDGRCQVVVTAGTVLPVSPRTGLVRFTITQVTADEVQYEGELPGNNIVGSGGGVGDSNTVQNLQVTVNGISGGRAVVSLRPA